MIHELTHLQRHHDRLLTLTRAVQVGYPSMGQVLSPPQSHASMPQAHQSCCSSCTGFTIISTTYVSEDHKASMICQLHMHSFCSFQVNIWNVDCWNYCQTTLWVVDIGATQCIAAGSRDWRAILIGSRLTQYAGAHREDIAPSHAADSRSLARCFLPGLSSLGAWWRALVQVIRLSFQHSLTRRSSVANKSVPSAPDTLRFFVSLSRAISC